MTQRIVARATLGLAATVVALALAPQRGTAMTPPALPGARLRPDATYGSCTTTYTSVGFGTYDPQFASATTGTGSIGFTCTGFVFQMTVTISAGSSNSVTARTMSDGAGHAMAYALNLPNGTNWGDGSTGNPGYSVNFPAAGTPYNATIAGSVPARQTTLPAGSYSDAPVVTFTSL